jgi:hypothetical protein
MILVKSIEKKKKTKQNIKLYREEALATYTLSYKYNYC